jgi:serine/threonine protein kinase
VPQCSSCGVEVSESSRFCPSCGHALNTDAFATHTVAVSSGSSPSKSADSRPFSASISSSGSLNEGRFPPGALLAARYRIVAMLGRGGMGEVYRAEDLTLGQQVALKFLPEAVATNANAVGRFRNEVRIARQVSHPNVCRVYDLGEVEGQLFLSMEYVDGEDLGSLLRRIGRLPGDKALEIARQLCAGLAAAHGKGVLHRDLKPSNVMLDSHGQVLLTDFGLAGLAEQIEGAEVRNGTPAYMAPEQLAGKEVTVKSDIYSLGLVLYEIFTGKRPFEANTLAELVRARSQTMPASPSTLVRDLDPVVERVILRCLETNPASRPSSALAVAGALPGGDPLAAALAAGETPSPEMVAAAGEGTGLGTRSAVSLFVAILLGLFVSAALAIYSSALEQIHPEYSPEVLSQKVRDVIQRLGYDAHPADSATGFSWYQSFVDYVKDHDKPAPRWNEILTQQPSLLRFWHRQSAYPLTGLSFHDDLLTPGIVDQEDPPPTLSGMLYLEMDASGRLVRFETIPPQRQEAQAKQAAPVDWNALFAAAALDPAKFQPAEPLWTWLSASDTRAAWTGTWPGTSRPLRVEAAAFQGKPVAFSLIGPWTKPDRMPSAATPVAEETIVVIFAVVALVICVGATLLTRRNLIQGRGDRRGALRLGCFIFCMHMALWITRTHFAASIGTLAMFLLALCTSVFYGMVVWTVYIALEPYVRRRWPQTLISWTSVLTGRLRDPIVGRDVLVGIALGVMLPVISGLPSLWLQRVGAEPPDLGSTSVLLGARSTIGTWLMTVPHGVRDALFFFFLIFVLRVLLRNQWVAAAAFALLFSSLNFLGASHPVVNGITSLLALGLFAFSVLRWGLLTLAVGIYVAGVLGNSQVTVQSSAWYFGSTVFMLGSVLALTAWAFHTSIAGRRLWKQDLFE